MTPSEQAANLFHGPSGPVVLNIAFPFAVVGPEAVGGAEVMCSTLEAVLPSLGFRSVVVARRGSQPAGQLYGTPVPEGEIDDHVREQTEAAHQANIDRAIQDHPVALVHMHGLDFHKYRFRAEIPILVTLHLPPAWYPDTIWHLPSNYHLICVSETQKASCPASAQSRLLVIPNGVPLPDATSLRSHGRYALMLARICPEKNLAMGFDAARQANMPCVLGGEVFPYREHQRYFAEEIAPRLTVVSAGHTGRTRAESSLPDARFVGPVTGPAKSRLLSRAACLLLPSLAPETSSLVAMEALAAGVPVVAVTSGAVPEIVDDGRTGFLISPARDMAAKLAAALRRIGSLDRTHCRHAAELRFSATAMVQSYAALYRRSAGTVLPLPPPNPGSPGIREELKGVTSGRIKTTLIQGTPALLALKQDWAELWGADPTATPFQHPAWLIPWARQFGPDGTIYAVEQRSQAGSLLGLLPLFVYTELLQNSCPLTSKLLLLGAGTTDYMGGTFHAGAAEDLASVALQHAMRQIPAWQKMDLLQLRDDAPLFAAGQNAGLVSSAAEPCAILSLTAPVPAKVAANVRRYRKRATTSGPLLCTVADHPAAASDYFEELVQLHGQRWQTRHQEGVLNDPAVLGHHREAIPQMFTAGLLRLFRLRCGTQTLAVLYALADARNRSVRRLYLYLIGIETSRMEWSPGTLILAAVREYAQENGFQELDLLRGGERYKDLWGALSKPTHALHCSR